MQVCLLCGLQFMLARALTINKKHFLDLPSDAVMFQSSHLRSCCRGQNLDRSLGGDCPKSGWERRYSVWATTTSLFVLQEVLPRPQGQEWFEMQLCRSGCSLGKNAFGTGCATSRAGEMIQWSVLASSPSVPDPEKCDCDSQVCHTIAHCGELQGEWLWVT